MYFSPNKREKLLVKNVTFTLRLVPVLANKSARVTTWQMATSAGTEQNINQKPGGNKYKETCGC